MITYPEFIALIVAAIVALAGGMALLHWRERRDAPRRGRDTDGLDREQKALIPPGPSMPVRERLRHGTTTCKGFWNTTLRGATPDKIWCPYCTASFPATRANQRLAKQENDAGYNALLAAHEGAELLRKEEHERA